MVKCEVIADRVTLVVGKGSIVMLDEVQAEVARQFVKPVNEDEEKPKRKAKKQ